MPLDSFLVLGIIPGTSIVLTFNEVLLACLSLATVCGLGAYYRELKSKRSPVPLHQRPIHEQLILTLPATPIRHKGLALPVNIWLQGLDRYWPTTR